MSNVARKLFPECDIEQAVNEWFDENVPAPNVPKRKSPNGAVISRRVISCSFCDYKSNIPIGKKDPNGRFKLVSFDKGCLELFGIAFHADDDFTVKETVNYYLCTDCNDKLEACSTFCLDLGTKIKNKQSN
jgi:hypothetical protein